jgi:hypothetical protein
MQINLEFFNKQNFSNFMYYQFNILFSTYIFALLLTYNEYSPIVASISVFILSIYSYFTHVVLHIIPYEYNVHLLFHHSKTEETDNFFRYLMIEFFTNIMFFVVFYFLQSMINIHFVPNILIFYYAFFYISVHIINYSIFHLGNNHHLHHINYDPDELQDTCNYGPDYFDHFFNTSCNDDYEDLNHTIPNLIIAFLVTYCIFQPTIS